VSGKRKRLRVYGKTKAEAHQKLVDAKASASHGTLLPDKTWLLGDYLDYWLAEVVSRTKRPKTYSLYEGTVRLYLKPGIGKMVLTRLTVPIVQSFLNEQSQDGQSARRVEITRTVLSSALTHAMREELLARNVARLVTLTPSQRKKVTPWTTDEALSFLRASSQHPLYAAFLLLLLYGMRRGELLGLRWSDIDFEVGEFNIRQQLQRVGKSLELGQLKTETSERSLPLLGLVRTALEVHQEQQERARRIAGDAWQGYKGNEALIFTTATGRPIEPDNFRRSFYRACAAYGIRKIKPHHVRHTVTTLLKKFGVPDRDAQAILGHSNVATTRQIYQHVDIEDKREGLGKLESVFAEALARESTLPSNSRQGDQAQQKTPPESIFWRRMTGVLFGGPPGTRTQDILLKSHTQHGIKARATEVNKAMEGHRKRWLVGVVAVSTAVRIMEPDNKNLYF
jgi:integrase